MSQEAINITGAAAAAAGASAAATINGASFNVDALTNMIVPFEFDFEGQKLKGRWFKYKTTTPEVIKERRERYLQRLEEYVALEAQFKGTNDPNEVLKLQQNKNELEEEAQRVKYSWLAEAIVEWNAVDGNQQPLPIEILNLAGFPLPFLVAFGEHLIGTRTGANPT